MMDNIAGKDNLTSPGQFHGAEVELITMYHSRHVLIRKIHKSPKVENLLQSLCLLLRAVRNCFLTPYLEMPWCNLNHYLSSYSAGIWRLFHLFLSALLKYLKIITFLLQIPLSFFPRENNLTSLIFFPLIMFYRQHIQNFFLFFVPFKPECTCHMMQKLNWNRIFE